MALASVAVGPAAYRSTGFTVADDDEPSDLRLHALASVASKLRRAKARTSSVKLEHRHERLLRNLHRADPLHPPLALLLFFQQLALAGHVAPVALGKHVLAHRGDGFTRHDLPTDCRLDRHLVHLARDDRLQLLDQ